MRLRRPCRPAASLLLSWRPAPTARQPVTDSKKMPAPGCGVFNSMLSVLSTIAMTTLLMDADPLGVGAYQDGRLE